MGPVLFTTKRKESDSVKSSSILCVQEAAHKSRNLSKCQGVSLSELGEHAVKHKGDTLGHKVGQGKSLGLAFNNC